MQLNYLKFANEVLLIDVSVMQRFITAELGCFESGLDKNMRLELTNESQKICICLIPDEMANLHYRHLFFQVKLLLIH